jgi:biotin-(acetyl-CoA carboxylase) ligase
VTQGLHTYNAIAREIDDAGRLVIDTESGHTVTLSSGQIALI